MLIALAQVAAQAGNIHHNLQHHRNAIALAQEVGARLIVFPELSLSGYEPSMASSVAVSLGHPIIHGLSALATQTDIVISAGIPTHTETLPNISALFFFPNGNVQAYGKKYLHPDEEPYFAPAINNGLIVVDDLIIGFAICFEISVTAHEELTFSQAPALYIASVVKYGDGTAKALDRLQHLSSKYALPVLMVNAVGKAEGYDCGGKTSIWYQGKLLAQLSDTDEGLLFFDSEKLQAFSMD
jgi:predicted amidohydrolase